MTDDWLVHALQINLAQSVGRKGKIYLDGGLYWPRLSATSGLDFLGRTLVNWKKNNALDIAALCPRPLIWWVWPHHIYCRCYPQPRDAPSGKSLRPESWLVLTCGYREEVVCTGQKAQDHMQQTKHAPHRSDVPRLQIFELNSNYTNKAKKLSVSRHSGEWIYPKFVLFVSSKIKIIWSTICMCTNVAEVFGTPCKAFSTCSFKVTRGCRITC